MRMNSNFLVLTLAWAAAPALAADQCPEPVRFAMRVKKSPNEKVHTCDTQKVSFEGTPATLVQVTGLVSFTGVVYGAGETRKFVELPGPSRGVVAEKLADKLKAPFEGKEALECDSKSKVRKEVVDLEPVLMHGAGAWKALFKHPFTCRWNEEKPAPIGSESSSSRLRHWISKTSGVAYIARRSDGTDAFDLGGVKIAQKDAGPAPEAAPAPVPSPLIH